MRAQDRKPSVSLETSRPRAGRRFAPTHELAVLPGATQAAEQLPGAHRGVVVVSEMVGPTGIPDLTALVGDQRAFEQRLTCPVPPLLNEIDAGAVAVASAHVGRTVEQLAEALGWPSTTVSRRLPMLVRSGAFNRRGDKFTRNESLRPLGRIYAIEAKVSDWRRAVRQAHTYALWADSYVVVLGHSTSAATGLALEQVQADRAGLVVNGQWVRRPNLRPPSRARRLWAAEHLVAAVRG